MARRVHGPRSSDLTHPELVDQLGHEAAAEDRFCGFLLAGRAVQVQAGNHLRGDLHDAGRVFALSVAGGSAPITATRR